MDSNRSDFLLSQCLSHYERLLAYVKVVTRNYAEKSINNTLDYVSGSTDMAFLERFYETTLESLQQQKNDVRLDRRFRAWPCCFLTLFFHGFE